MKASEIFKMELWKNCRDTSYLLLAGIIGGIGWLVSGALFILKQGNLLENYMGQQIYGLTLLLGMLTFVGYLVVAFLYPLHLLSSDYRNRVINLMVASGVKRTSLYFAKIGATFVSTIVVLFLMCVTPITLTLLDENSLLHYLLREMKLNTDTLLILALVVVMYLASLTMLCFSVILLKGNYLSILLTWALQQGCSLVSTPILLPVMNALENEGMSSFYFNSMLITMILIYLAEILIFGALSVYKMNRQNL